MPPRRSQASSLRRVLALCAGAVIVGPPPAGAQEWPKIVDRNYSIDAYVGPVFGPPRTVAMGGVGTALGEGSTGMLWNSAAAAKRPMSARDRWDWDFDLDAMAPLPGSDLQNERRDDPLSGQLATFGLLGLYRAWGLGLSGSTATYQLPASTDQSAAAVDVQTFLLRLVLARSFNDEALAVGLGLRLGGMSVMQGKTELFSMMGWGLDAGVIYSGHDAPVRLGLRLALGLRARQDQATCDPSSCAGRILPESAITPWEIAAGVAYRPGPTPWSVAPPTRFRDERALVLGADLVLTGPSGSGVASSGFARGELRPSGRTASISVRMGAEHETVPGRLRLRGGGYWEPARLAAASSRVHGTAGLEVRLFRFNLWGERRVAVSAATDVAVRYAALSIAFGLWH